MRLSTGSAWHDCLGGTTVVGPVAPVGIAKPASVQRSGVERHRAILRRPRVVAHVAGWILRQRNPA